MFYVVLIIFLLFLILKGLGSGAKQREKHNEDVLRSLGNMQQVKNPENVGSSADPRFQFTKSHCGQKLMASARNCPRCGVKL
jgi:hypothetical protein